MIGDRKPKFFYGYIVALASFLVMVTAGGVFFTFGVFFKPILTEFGWTRAMTSGAFSLCGLLAGFLGIGVGRLTDRFGPRLMLTACGFFLGLGFLLMSQISAIWQLYLFYGVIIAIGMGAAWIPIESTVARWFMKRRGMMMGIVMAGNGVGGIIMPPIASRLIFLYGWRTSYIIIGIIVLVLIILAAQFLRRDPSTAGQLPNGDDEVKVGRVGKEARGFSLQQAIYTRQFWLLLAISFCLWFSITVIMVHIVPHTTELGISAIIAANILAVVGGASIFGRIIMGSAADRIGYRLCLIIGFILMAAAFSWLLVAKELWMLYLFSVLFGFSYGSFMSLYSITTAWLFGLGSLGVILGIVEFVGMIGGAISPILAGHIFDISESYQLAFLVCAAVSVTGLILVLLLRPITGKGGTNDSKRST